MRLFSFALVTGLTLSSCLAYAAPDPKQMAWRWLDRMALSGDSEVMAEVAVDMRLVATSFTGDALLVKHLAPGLQQAMDLMHGCEIPASCGLASDLMRQILTTSVARSGSDPQRAATVGYLNRHDRFSRILAPGHGLAHSDILGAEKLIGLAEQSGLVEPGASDGITDGLLERWDLGDELYRAFLTRLSAWSAGAIVAWPELSQDERSDAIAFWSERAVPPRDLFPRVTGAINPITWIATAELPLSEEESAKSPDLAELIHAGVFAGPMRPAVSGEMLFLTAQPNIGPAYSRWRASFAAGESADALLHNWDAEANMVSDR